MGSFAARVLLVSLPNFLSIFAAIGLFCSNYPLRERAAMRLALCTAAVLGTSCISSLYHTALAPVMDATLGEFGQAIGTIALFVAVLLCCVPLSRLTFRLEWWDALFCCTAGYALQNLAHATWELGVSLLAPGAELSSPESSLGQLAVCAAVFVPGYFLLVRRIRTDHLEGEGDRRALLVLIGVIAVNIVLDTTVRELHDMGAISALPYTVLRVSQLLVCALTLYLDYEILYSNRMRADAAATRQLMEDERRQYQLSRDTIEAINVRCHDIRHQVRALSGADGGGREFMESLDGLISIYDSGVQTGNPALDVILTEKSLLCRGKGIGLTCSADGQALSFMAEQDIYSLFGNALDNAIDAADSVGDPERRLIDVSVRTMGQMAVIQVRNFYEGELRHENGTLRSTKSGGLHGYGSKSMRLVAERYGGSVSFEAEGGIFRLHALIPMA